MSNTSQDRKPNTLFFAGTDTDVGKTYVATRTAEHIYHRFTNVVDRKLGVYKPVESGCRRDSTGLVAADAVALWQAAGRPRKLEDVCPQRLEAPLAPTRAAESEGKSVDRALLRDGARCWESECDVLIVEGAGGLFSPLADGLLNIDLAKQFDRVKLLIVAANRLGVIHQTLSTCAAAQHAGIEPTGIILCQVDTRPDPSVASNAAEIEGYTDVPVIAEIGHEAIKSEFAFIDPFLN